jgi:pimeloyl-ACP methyl ester carboxylesterase
MLFVLLGIFVALFVIIQTRTLYFDRHYLSAVGWLLLISVTAFSAAIWVILAPASNLDWVIVAISVFLAIFFGALFVVKMKYRDNWRESARRLLRTPTSLDFPHDRFTVRTSDGVEIRGYHVHKTREPEYARRAVIIAHGGFRSKDLFIKALMTAWLFEEFDIISFDFRGHGESGGYWTGDGKTVADLKAVIDFAKQKGYQRIGVYGRSMGGWTAILETVDHHDVDAIVVAGLPPGFFSEVPEFMGRIRLLKYPGVPFLMRVIMGVRFRPFRDIRSPIKEIGQVSPVPILILFNETDPGAGVRGRDDHWESIPLDQRPPSYRRIRSFPFTAQEVYDAASEPKHLHILPGAAHVYSLLSTRDLFTQVEQWFRKYLA